MRSLVVFSFAVCVAVMLVAAPYTAQATTLLTTGHALNNGVGPSSGVWQGSQHYAASLIGDTLDADVEFAVFAPGNFQNFLNENGIVFTDPAPSELIYAYQIVQIGAGTTPVTILSVGLQDNESLGISGVTFIPHTTNYGTYPLQPVRDPGTTGGGPGVDFSSFWSTTTGPFPPGEVTGILFYSSPQNPELGFATVNAGFAGQFHADSLPNPVPEPATLVLCLAAGLGLMVRRRL